MEKRIDENMSQSYENICCFWNRHLKEINSNVVSVQKHNSFYHKSLLFEHNGSPRKISDFLVFDETDPRTPFSRQSFVCLNHPSRLTDRIRENERTLSIYGESLTKTAPQRIAVDAYVKSCEKNLPNELYEITDRDINCGESGKRIVEFYTSTNPDVPVPFVLSFFLPFYRNDDGGRKRVIRNITDRMYSLGWSLSTHDFVKEDDYEQPFDDENRKITLTSISFEAKYTDFDPVLYGYLYHVVPSRYIEKVRKNGLVPKSGSSFFDYDERVYLFRVEDRVSMEDYASNKTLGLRLKKNEEHEKRKNKDLDRTDDSGFYVLRIDVDELKRSDLYRKGKLRLYLDPSFSREFDCKDSIAVFTYNNIPKNMIEKEILFCKVDDLGGIAERKIVNM